MLIVIIIDFVKLPHLSIPQQEFVSRGYIYAYQKQPLTVLTLLVQS